MAQQQTPMYMKDWIERLDVILQMNGRELLTHAGNISHKRALEKSNSEYQKYKKEVKNLQKEQNLIELEEDIKKLTGNYPKTTYGSTETLFCSIPSIQYPGSFLFDWRVMYSEFVYEDDKVDTLGDLGPSGLDLMNIDHVKVGGHYQLIATPFQTDMTRYVMPDIFECVAERDDILETEFPVFKYYARADRILVLHNFTRITEDEILEVFKAAEVPFVEFTARRELDGSRDYLHLYIELRKPVEMDILHAKINSLLREYDRDWRDLSNFLDYDPLKITILPKGSFNRYLNRQKGMPKVERIIMKEERFKDLISSVG